MGDKFRSDAALVAYNDFTHCRVGSGRDSDLALCVFNDDLGLWREAFDECGQFPLLGGGQRLSRTQSVKHRQSGFRQHQGEACGRRARQTNRGIFGKNKRIAHGRRFIRDTERRQLAVGRCEKVEVAGLVRRQVKDDVLARRDDLLRAQEAGTLLRTAGRHEFDVAGQRAGGGWRRRQ